MLFLSLSSSVAKKSRATSMEYDNTKYLIWKSYGRVKLFERKKIDMGNV